MEVHPLAVAAEELDDVVEVVWVVVVDVVLDVVLDVDAAVLLEDEVVIAAIPYS